jgi:hypothetical protein
MSILSHSREKLQETPRFDGETCRFSFKSSSEPEGQLLPGAAYLVFEALERHGPSEPGAWKPGAGHCRAGDISVQHQKMVELQASKPQSDRSPVRCYLMANDFQAPHHHILKSATAVALSHIHIT